MNDASGSITNETMTRIANEVADMVKKEDVD